MTIDITFCTSTFETVRAVDLRMGLKLRIAWFKINLMEKNIDGFFI